MRICLANLSCNLPICFSPEDWPRLLRSPRRLAPILDPFQPSFSCPAAQQAMIEMAPHFLPGLSCKKRPLCAYCLAQRTQAEGEEHLLRCGCPGLIPGILIGIQTRAPQLLLNASPINCKIGLSESVTTLLLEEILF